MTFDPEELKKRRAQRKRKKLIFWLRIGIGVLVLAACGLMIWYLSVGKKPPESEVNDPANHTVIRLAAAGDLNVTQRVVESGGADYRYTDMLMDVLPLLSDADITALNFEGNLYGEPYGTDRSAPQSLMTALERAGVDYLQMANSYSIYHGMDGLSRTLQGIRQAGMVPLGAYASHQEAQEKKGYTLCTVQGIKIALVAFTKGMDGRSLPEGSEYCVNLLYTDYGSTYQKVNTDGIKSVLKAVAKENPDITIAMLHWGSELNDQINPTQKKITELLKEQGVDAIIGSHPHYVQAMNYDAESGFFLSYSLGDFMGDAQIAGTNYSVLLDLEVTKDGATGATKITGYSYTPIYQVYDEEGNLQILRIEDAIAAYENTYIGRVSAEIYNAMKSALSRIESRINKK